MVTKPAQPTPAHLHHIADETDDLTIDYPTEDGERLAETEAQYVPLTETVSALRNRFLDRPDVYIIGNMLVYYRMNDTTVRVAPDVFAVFGAPGSHPRDSWFVWREGKAPDFVLEVASRGTRVRDRIEKRDIYARMGVTEYWRFDPTSRRSAPTLIGERLVNGVYQPIPVARDRAGILRGYSAILGLDICLLDGPELKLYDPVGGVWLRNHRESEAAATAAEAAQQEAEAAQQEAEAAYRTEARARQDAEARIRELEALLQQRG